MQIAHVTATFPPYLSGTGTACHYSAITLDGLGHHVTIYTANVLKEPYIDSPQYRVQRLPYQLKLGNAPLLAGLLTLPRYDLIHLHYPFIFGAELILLGKWLRNQPYVVTYHNDLKSKGFRHLLFTIYQKSWTASLLRNAKRVITTSMDFALTNPYLSRASKFHTDHVVEIPNGVDIKRFHPNLTGETVRTRHGIDLEQFVFLFVGAMDTVHHFKSGVPQLLNAFATLSDRRCILLLVGDGDRVASYTALAQQLDIDDRVIFPSWLPHEQLTHYYAAADLVVQPSVLFEPFGLVAIEAMACGKPVIVSNLPGVRGVVTANVDGLLSEPGNTQDLTRRMEETLTMSSEQRRTMGMAGRHKVEQRYSWDRIGRQLESVYQQALADLSDAGQ